MQVFKDGSTGEITESEQLLKDMLNAIPVADNVREVRFGTKAELERQKGELKREWEALQSGKGKDE